MYLFMYAWCMHENKLVCTLSPLQLEKTIPVGKEGDVCIHTDQLGYGVLSVSTSKQIICTTCCFNKTSCQHVQHIKTLFDTQIDPSPILQLMQMEVQSDSSNTQRSSYRTLQCRSWKKIPFLLPPKLSRILTLSHIERFNLHYGLTVLHSDMTTCCICSCNSLLVDHILSEETLIILSNNSFPAKGSLFIIHFY